MQPSKAPFQWFGGKSRVANIIWEYFHDVDLYVEPFAGSLAVLLARPQPIRGIEIVNDIDCYIANFWRAVKNDPVEVAKYANNPENEADLTARHIWLVKTGKERIARIMGDPDFYDPKVAGWWVWGINCWIGSGFCSGKGAWTADENGRLVKKRDLVKEQNNPENKGVKQQRINTAHPQGVNRKSIHQEEGEGVNRQLIHLTGGRGINRGSIHINRDGLTSNGVHTGETALIQYMNRLAGRLRYVKICCGDWSRVVTEGALAAGTKKGVFLDPPYDQTLHNNGCYNHDTNGISEAVREWAIKNGEREDYRIVLCGYEGEHEMPENWIKIPWVATRSYGRKGSQSKNCENRYKERLWISPHCTRRKPTGSIVPLTAFVGEETSS